MADELCAKLIDFLFYNHVTGMHDDFTNIYKSPAIHGAQEIKIFKKYHDYLTVSIYLKIIVDGYGYFYKLSLKRLDFKQTQRVWSLKRMSMNDMENIKSRPDLINFIKIE